MLYVYDKGIISLSGNHITWKIYNFFNLPLSVDCEIRSKQFPHRGGRYTLYIWPRGKKGTENWFGICLYKYDEPGIGDSVQFSISTPFGNIKTCTVKCSENNLFRQERFMEWSDFLTLSQKIAPNGCLTIVCKLSMEDNHGHCKEYDSKSEALMYPMHDPHVKHQYSDYQSANPLALRSSFRVSSPEGRISSFEAPAFNFGSSWTAKSFYIPSDFENAFEYIPESMETKDSDINLPYDTNQTDNENTLRNNFCRGLSTTFKKSNLKVLVNPTTTNKQKIINKSGCDSTELLKNKNSNTQEISKSEGEVTDAVACSSLCYSEESGSSAGHCSKGLRALSLNMKQLYLERKHFDLTIIMDGKEFKVLRAILMARSPVFSEMFSGTEVKNTHNIIVIDSFDACDSSVFHDFLIYIYSGEIENLSGKNICGLYCAACNFQIPELKEQCIKFLQTSQTIDNMTDIFRLSNDDTELLDAAVVLLAKNMEIVMSTDEWKRFLKEEPDKAVEYHLKALKIGYKKTIV